MCSRHRDHMVTEKKKKQQQWPMMTTLENNICFGRIVTRDELHFFYLSLHDVIISVLDEWDGFS